MKNQATLLLTTLALGVSTCIAGAAEGSGPPPGRGPGAGGYGAGGGQSPRSPLLAVLDANADGTIDADEIAKATEALKKLDKNNDGKVTPDDYRPPMPAGGRGQGGPGRSGGGGGAGGGGGRPPSNP